MIEDAAASVKQVLGMVEEGYVTSLGGKRVPVSADTLCIHGDTTGAPALAALVRRELERAGIEVRAMGEFIP